ncbi:8690_t:CDS:1 [Diversispora eburnea]|uniref:8690_t:CDS:1 n=1 Tax=Diversispora eburnea TaxID=1213867 RepID=A0A9N8YVB7_9GLOM|nr:8690_t:CDS:1 [Diversispora eburnea]
MATKIPTEILIKILNNNAKSSHDLYSSLLVNRFWCKVTIPILWKLPLGQKYHQVGQPWKLKWSEKVWKKALCIRTYISCMDTQARTLLTQNGFDLSLSPPQATFDYPSFTHKFRFYNLANFIYYSRKIIGSDNAIIKSRLLFREICKLIINRSTFLNSFKIQIVREYHCQEILNSDLISSIMKLPGVPKVFKKLETFISATRRHELTTPVYESFALICDNILNMNLTFYSYSQVQLLEKLISVQKRLENLSIINHSRRDNNFNFNSLLWAIISQKETLKSLRLKSVNFYHFKGKSSPIGLQELHIESCSRLYKLDCLILASSFTQLSSFRLRNRFQHSYGVYHQEFIIKILETANKNLKNICLELNGKILTDNILSVILNYCTKVTKLNLPRLNLEQVIAIFNNNFNELRSFSFIYGKESDANKLLCQIAESVPESLETIEIKMGMFSADSLRKFFEGWCRKGGENKKMVVQRSVISDEHWKVIEEYRVQFDMLNYGFY